MASQAPVAVVTGASRGAGRGIALALGAHQFGIRGVGAAQRRVQHLALLGDIDHLARIHGGDPLAQAHVVGQLCQLRHDRRIHPLARIVQRQAGGRHRAGLRALRVRPEQIGRRRSAKLLGKSLQPGPGGAGRSVAHHAIRRSR